MNTKIGSASLVGSMVASIAPLACCWGPALLTGVAGISGGAMYFSWVHPISPYLFGFAFISLGYSFYKAYKPKKKGGCSNCVVEKPSFLRSKTYVWLVAVFVVGMFITINYFPELVSPY
ncbi:MAG: hypothetical protein JKY52_00520 [Flavobacteriales bacterium]|nr:hypothetical protein [Flavobacteriales bacterium]